MHFALVTKMPVTAIKALYRSCPLSLTVAPAETPDGVVLATTLTMFDDPAQLLTKKGSAARTSAEFGVVRHGIVMISETMPDLDWEGIGAKLFSASRQPIAVHSHRPSAL